MDQVEVALRIFPHEAEPVDDERPGKDWGVLAQLVCRANGRVNRF